MADFYFCCLVALLAHDSLAYVTADGSMEQVETVSDYNEYCHYAAGLAGLGLSRLFYASGLEEFPPDILSNSMGLFIQVPVMYHMCRHAFPWRVELYPYQCIWLESMALCHLEAAVYQ